MFLTSEASASDDATSDLCWLMLTNCSYSVNDFIAVTEGVHQVNDFHLFYCNSCYHYLGSLSTLPLNLLMCLSFFMITSKAFQNMLKSPLA